MKLTKLQQEILDEMKKPGARAFYMPYMGRFRPEPYWFISTSHKKCTKQIERLIALGLVKIIREDWRDKEAIIIEQSS